MSGPVRIACFGDSLTEGYGLEYDEALPVVLERLLHEEGVNARCLNFGVSGDTAGDGLARIQPVLNAEPDAVIVEFGANDSFVGDPVPTVHANLTAIIETLKSRNIPILLVGIVALPEFGLDQMYQTAFNALFGDLAKTHNLPLFPDILSCYFAEPSKKLMDGLHPNAQGVEAIARGLLPQVKELVKTTS